MIIIHEEITTRTVLIFVSATRRSIANRLTYLDAEFHKKCAICNNNSFLNLDTQLLHSILPNYDDTMVNSITVQVMNLAFE